MDKPDDNWLDRRIAEYAADPDHDEAVLRQMCRTRAAQKGKTVTLVASDLNKNEVPR